MWEKSLKGLKVRCYQNCFPSAGSEGEPLLWPFQLLEAACITACGCSTPNCFCLIHLPSLYTWDHQITQDNLKFLNHFCKIHLAMWKNIFTYHKDWNLLDIFRRGGALVCKTQSEYFRCDHFVFYKVSKIYFTNSFNNFTSCKILS